MYVQLTQHPNDPYLQNEGKSCPAENPGRKDSHLGFLLGDIPLVLLYCLLLTSHSVKLSCPVEVTFWTRVARERGWWSCERGGAVQLHIESR